MRLGYTTTLALLMCAFTAFAQPANDECTNAIILDNVKSFCSANGAYSNAGATISAQTSPGCFPNNQDNNDVWFAFVAQGSNISVSVTGNTAINPGGTIRNPQFILYKGNCNNLTEVACISDAFNRNSVEVIRSGLEVGALYYIRVSARNGNTGTFQMCINNFNEVPDPEGDCSTAVLLCDKSSFTVQKVSGTGSDRNEIGNVSCGSFTCPLSESSSTWYKWTCKDPGSLTFKITPLNPVDDIDFVLYELPNGVDNCSNKRDIRCMASGENVGEPVNNWLRCTGATGLREGETDNGETCGCQGGDNNFAAPVNMVAGRSYALVINNFSNSGSGFTIEFGGTGTFLGPTADFNISSPTVCVGKEVSFTDASFFTGTISSYKWNFGNGASIATSNARGPHTVSYRTPGTKSITLTIETDRGCVITQIKTIEVECCGDHFTLSGNSTDLTCPNSSDGAIDLTVTNNYGPYTYIWNDSLATTEDLTGLPRGSYKVIITDQATCDTTISFDVGGPPQFAFDTLITRPTCGGGTDGAVTLQVSGGTGPYQYNWQNSGFGTNNGLTNIPRGDYTVIVRDANGCDTALTIPVRELELILDPTVNAVTPPTCNGFSDGSIVVDIANGLGPFEYNWNDGQGFRGANSLTGLRSGIYTVQVRDANLCEGNFQFDMQDHPPLVLTFDTENASCNGIADGSAAAVISGGVGNYTFSWSNGQTKESITDLSAGNYTVTIRDGNQCEIVGDTTVTEPESVFVNVTDVVDVICHGDATGAITVAGSGGTMPYSFSIAGAPFQPEPVFTGLTAGNYTITIEDAEGCGSTVNAMINQPPPLIVDAGDDQTVELGYTIDLQAIANAPGVSFGWSPPNGLSCTDCFDPTVMPARTTVYTVTVTNGDNCSASDSLKLTVTVNRPIYAPSAFSPNNDGANDFFTIFGGPGARIIRKLIIFDRWGNLVFETNDIPLGQERFGWDGSFNGKPMSPGVFVYMAEIEFIDDVIVQYDGDITIVR